MEYNPTFFKMPSTFFIKILARKLVLIGILAETHPYIHMLKVLSHPSLKMTPDSSKLILENSQLQIILK
jgi:hypothetical protein